MMLFIYAVHFLYSFFFQAEDGIRDADVTGVQTCALPIFGEPRNHKRRRLRCPFAIVEQATLAEASTRESAKDQGCRGARERRSASAPSANLCVKPKVSPTTASRLEPAGPDAAAEHPKAHHPRSHHHPRMCQRP